MTHFKRITFFAILIMLLAACDAPPPDTAITVVLLADGKRTELTTEATTVREVLAQAQITLGELDRVRPPETFAISAGAVITVTRIMQQFETETRVVAYEQQIVRDASIPTGQQRVIQGGRNGKLELTYRLVFEDGQQVERVEVKRELLEPPQPEMVLVGVAQAAQSAVPFTGTLVYLSNNNAYVMRQATSNRRALTSEGDLDGWVLALSPDGKTLLYTRALSQSTEGPLNTLWAIDTVRADSKPQQVKPGGIMWAGWSPDGKTLAYSTGQLAAGPPGWRANNDLWTAPYSARTIMGTPTEVLTPTLGGTYGWWGRTYAWSPNGKLIAIGATESVFLVDLKTRKQSALASFAAINTYSNWAWTPTVSWTPDGNFILTVLPGLAPAGQPASETPVFDVWSLAVDGSFRAKLANEAGMWAAPRSAPTLNPALSAFYAIIYGRAEAPYTSDRSRYTLYVADRDGSNRNRLFPTEGSAGLEGGPGLKGLTDLAWSPTPPRGGTSSSQVVLVYQGDLYLVDVPEGRVQQLTAEGNIKLVRWAR